MFISRSESSLFPKEILNRELNDRLLSVFLRLEADSWLIKEIKRLKNNQYNKWNLPKALLWVGDRKPGSYLEIGTRRGRSICCLISSSLDTRCTSMDLWISNYSNVPNPGPDFVFKEMKKFGYKHPVRFISGDSAKTMAVLEKEEAKFDVITVDGNHTYAGAKLDLYRSSKLLNDGGVMVMDDLTHPDHMVLKKLWFEFKKDHPAWVFYEILDPAGCGVGFKYGN